MPPSKVFSPLTTDGPLGALVSPDPDAPAAASLSVCDRNPIRQKPTRTTELGAGDADWTPTLSFAQSSSCTAGPRTILSYDRLSTLRSGAAIAAIDLRQPGSVCHGPPCGEQTVLAPQAVARVLEACGQDPPASLTTAAVTVGSEERARSTASHPSEVAIQPDEVLMTKPARCKPATTGCRLGAMDWLGRMASDFRTAKFSGDMQNPRALQRRASV